jgi:hypothetical protein
MSLHLDFIELLLVEVVTRIVTTEGMELQNRIEVYCQVPAKNENKECLMQKW